jgi:CheY-like chemotaxis protein/anti-sigma regulatory factor (Ser/Thr protein kinase)
MSWCDAHVLIEQALKNAEASLDKKVIHFGRSLNARRSGVTADAHRLGQVLANLLGNAIKFTPSGGMITVSTEDDSSGGLRVSVSDTGIGIDASHLEHIFEPFERGELQHRYEYTGLGLGLAIARSLLTRMNGVISAASEGEGRGARFTFILPDAEFAPVLRRAAVPAQTGAPPAAEPMHGLNNRSVLLVEDHPATADILARLLRRHGCAVKTVATKAAAMEAVSAEKFDVILSDIGLPDGSGHELLHALRQRGVTTPAIALSGYGAAGDIAASADAGFAEHLTKPVDFDFLRSAIERTANRQRQS